MLLGAREFLAQLRILGRDPDRARILVALARVDAAERNQERAAETVFVGTEQGREDDVAAALETTVDAQPHTRTQTVGKQCVVRLDQADLPRQAGVFDRRERRCARAAVVAADVNRVGIGLGDAACDIADPRLRHEFDADSRVRRRAAQIVDQLREILDRVDVVMRGR